MTPFPVQSKGVCRSLAFSRFYQSRSRKICDFGRRQANILPLRDQLKIVGVLLIWIPLAAEDEKLRVHSAGLLRSKWWGAEHSYFSGNGKASLRSLFDGPVTSAALNLPNTIPTFTA